MLVIDPYDYSTNLFDEWFRECFLDGVSICNGMRVVISGKKVPQPEGDWSFSSSLQELQGINNVKTWMAWAKKEGYPIPSEDALSEVIQIMNGNYNNIVNAIDFSFPKKHVPDAIISNEWIVK